MVGDRNRGIRRIPSPERSSTPSGAGVAEALRDGNEVGEDRSPPGRRPLVRFPGARGSRLTGHGQRSEGTACRARPDSGIEGCSDLVKPVALRGPRPGIRGGGTGGDRTRGLAHAPRPAWFPRHCRLHDMRSAVTDASKRRQISEICTNRGACPRLLERTDRLSGVSLSHRHPGIRVREDALRSG